MLSLDTREHILQTALSLFITKSYKAVTMSDLEKATGLTKGAFYHYFKNKEEIFIEIINKYYLSDQLFDNKVVSKMKTLKEYIDYTIRYIEIKIEKIKDLTKNKLPDPYLFLLIIEAHVYYPNFNEKWIMHEVLVFNQWEKIVMMAKESGEIKAHLSTSIIVENIIAIEMSMLRNIIKQEPFESRLSTLKLQYEQYYGLIKM